MPVPQEDRTTRKRVLLIEDNKDAREMLRMMLELGGHVVYEAADGASGLELLNVLSREQVETWIGQLVGRDVAVSGVRRAA